MKWLLRTWFLFACWALLIAVASIQAHIRSANNRSLAAFQHVQFPALIPTGWGILFTLSYPAFALVFFAWNRIVKKPLRERLGLVQFCMASLPQIIVPIVAIFIIFQNANGATPLQEGHFSGSNMPSSLLHVLRLSVGTVIGFWIASLLIFAFNVANSLRDKR